MEHSISRDVRPPGGTEFVSRHLERACLSDQSAVSLSWRRPSSRSRSERRVFLSPCVISRTMDLTVASLPESRSCLAVARMSTTGRRASFCSRARDAPGMLSEPRPEKDLPAWVILFDRPGPPAFGTLPWAEWLRRKADWIDPTRVRRPRTYAGF